MSTTNATDKIENPQLTDEFVEGVLNNTVGIMIVHLESYYMELDELEYKRHSSLDYHLHFLKYEIQNSVGVLCLDTSDFLESDKFTFGNNTFNTLISELTKTFIDIISTVIANPELPKSVVFHKSPMKLWEKFNQLKEDSFIVNAQRFSKYLQIEDGKKPIQQG